jgi:hypothetical protein
MDALKELDPQTKVSELTVEQFEAVMTRSLCRVVEFAAVRFAQAQLYAQSADAQGLRAQEAFDNHSQAAQAVRESISGPDWPRFDILSFIRHPDARDEKHVG